MDWTSFLSAGLSAWALTAEAIRQNAARTHRDLCRFGFFPTKKVSERLRCKMKASASFEPRSAPSFSPTVTGDGHARFWEGLGATRPTESGQFHAPLEHCSAKLPP